MFYYEEINQKYYIWSDKIKGKFGPFCGVYVKNKILGKFSDKIDINKYPGYKYSIGIGEKKIFIINKEGIEDILTHPLILHSKGGEK